MSNQTKYTKEHEWIRQDGESFVVGITDYAQKELGDVVFVDLPKIGVEIKQGSSFASVESVKAVSDVYAPVDGTVDGVNDKLSSAPELLNSAPFGDGWLLKIRMKSPDQLSSLMDEAAYNKYISELSK